MSYIGREPQIGNFQVCDAISVVNGQAAYTMQVDSTNVVPESANHVLCSLNGILQKSGSSFTISGSTITFASNLVTGDVIDFIHILGSTLDLGVPSDATVTNAKTNFVTTSSAAGLQIKGDGTTAGALQMNCEQNSHGIKLQSPPHSANQSYTLKFPSGNVTAGKFLKVDSVSGSGTTGVGTMTFADAGGGKVLQVVSSTGTAGFDTNSTSYVQVTGTGHGVAITPSATSSKVFITIMFEARSSNSSNFSINTILRDSTDLSGGTRFTSSYGSAQDFPVHMSFLDSPNTTSEVTYRIGTRSNTSSHNSRINASNQTFSYVAMEIGA